ncbi:uracil-DNA glycosylase family protein [Bifidobacterium cuniculi]|uniref:T/U mismatch-specific DNA glycosylase n=1 Tax=Bifidobacterium cuniculi TaxID=1688 RepID=A0A087AQA5_9BIFI|nr:uracil-DNA glycosylase family protein [Bifidobacterium cuniculi]KFI60955.1 T/U mismatch-specific DNA glycosylase [Bifidobacterium cuniculi]
MGRPSTSIHEPQWRHVEHGFGPLWAPDSRILFLGTMASPRSRQAGFFYMHPRNRFWPMLQALYADPDDPADVTGTTKDSRRAFALHHRIALWDPIESCDILGASDASIRNVVPSDLAGIVEGSDIGIICTTGRKSFEVFEKYQRPEFERRGIHVSLVPLPSTSPAYAARTPGQIIAMCAERLGPDGMTPNPDCTIHL